MTPEDVSPASPFVVELGAVVAEVERLQALANELEDRCSRMVYLDATPASDRLRDRVAWMAEADVAAVSVLLDSLHRDLRDRAVEFCLPGPCVCVLCECEIKPRDLVVIDPGGPAHFDCWVDPDLDMPTEEEAHGDH